MLLFPFISPYAFLKFLIVLSVKLGKRDWKWRLALSFPFSRAYLPILARSSGVYRTYLPLIFLFLHAEGDGSASFPTPLDDIASNSTLPRPDSATDGIWEGRLSSSLIACSWLAEMRFTPNKKSDITAYFETRTRGKLTKPHPRAHQFDEVYFSVWIERIPRASIDLDSDDRWRACS